MTQSVFDVLDMFNVNKDNIVLKFYIKILIWKSIQFHAEKWWRLFEWN